MNKQIVRCPHCQTAILKTKQNKEGKCPFRFCKGYGYNSMDTQDKGAIEKYLGKSKFSVDLGDVVMCIDIVEHDKLVCFTIGQPVVVILTQEEFNNLK